MDTASLAFRVAQRVMWADNRFQPPKNIVNGVSTGELPTEVLMVWKYVVEELGDKFNFGAGVQYWRNKCGKEGITLPAAYLKGGKGSTHGEWKVKSGDQIEEWIKQRLLSEKLISTTQRTAAEWQLEISSLQSAVEAAQDKIATHEKGLAEGNRVKQRTVWLAAAKKDLIASNKDLEKARAAVEGLQEAMDKHEDVKAPVITFERQFQAMLHEASNDLSKREVLAQAKAALAKFEEEMNTPKFATDSLLDIGDQMVAMWKMVKRGWDGLWKRVMSAFAKIEAWADDLDDDTKKLDKLVASAS